MKQFLKHISIVVMMSLGLAFAADNSIYIDQTGSNSTIDITQTGAGNVLRGIQGTGTSNATPANMTGDASIVDIRQIGQDNTLNIGYSVTTATDFGYGIDLTYYVTGNNGTATFNINNSNEATAASNLIDVKQIGNSAMVNLLMTGDKNSFTATTDGGANNSILSTINANETINNISMTGGGNNTLTQTITSNKATNNITTVGASNSITMSQTGVAGTNGHSATVDITGSSNTMSITQGGTVDNVLNVNSVGSGNTWTILQGQ